MLFDGQPPFTKPKSLTKSKSLDDITFQNYFRSIKLSEVCIILLAFVALLGQIFQRIIKNMHDFKKRILFIATYKNNI